MTDQFLNLSAKAASGVHQSGYDPTMLGMVLVALFVVGVVALLAVAAVKAADVHTEWM